jgi:AcrR family transcriptional regulator
VLAAADALFADADSPHTVSMDAIAAAAGVGKGTLFRAFGNREGLLDALWLAKLAALRAAVEQGEPPLGPGAPAAERIVAFLDAVLSFKLDNRHLIRAREASAGLRQSEHYRWMYGLLRRLVDEAAPQTEDAGYAAHALLSALHIDLVEELLASGRSPQDIRGAQAAFTRAVIGARQPT